MRNNQNNNSQMSTDYTKTSPAKKTLRVLFGAVFYLASLFLLPVNVSHALVEDCVGERGDESEAWGRADCTAPSGDITRTSFGLCDDAPAYVGVCEHGVKSKVVRFGQMCKAVSIVMARREYRKAQSYHWGGIFQKAFTIAVGVQVYRILVGVLRLIVGTVGLGVLGIPVLTLIQASVSWIFPDRHMKLME